MVKYEYRGRTFEFELEYPKSLAFEAAFTTSENTPLYTKLKDNSETVQRYSFPITAARSVSQVLSSIGLKDIDTSELMSSIGKPIFEDLGQSYLFPDQFMYMQKVKKYFSGIISTPTGSGKTTMITYICNMSQIRGKNILICAPTYSIVDEIRLRLDRYKINASMDFDPDANIWVINPVGFMARNNKEVYREWLENVDMLIVDEADGVTNSLEQLIKEFLINCKYFYGFSATADRKEGKRFDSITSLNGFNDTAARLLIFFGPMIVYRPPSRKIRLVVTPFNSGNYKNLWSYDKCVLHVTHSRNFPSYIKKCIEDNNKNGRSCILLPFTNREQVYYLLGHKSLQKYHIVMWTASGIVHNNGLVEGGAGLERVKEMVNNHELDLLMTSQVGFKGIDLVELKSVLFMTGSSYGVVTQILGRIFRYAGTDLPTVYFLENISENPLYNKAQRMRYEYITLHEHVTERMMLPYVEGWNFSP